MKLQWILVVAACFLALAPVTAQTLMRTVTGSAGEKLGAAVIRAGDQNGDGFQDVLVGAPGHDSGKGAVYCVSGGYLATGNGTILLWSVLPAAGAAGAFGTSLAMVGQLFGSPAPEFVVGAPFDGTTGSLFLIDGATHAVLKKWKPATADKFVGLAVVGIGDADLDGKPDVAVSSVRFPTVGVIGVVSIVGGAHLLNGTGIQTSEQGENGFGTSLASFDVDGDGRVEIAVGSPLNGAAEAGRAYLYSNSLVSLGSYAADNAGEHLGQSVFGAHDYDGDGALDLLASAPDWTDPTSGKPTGRVAVLSGAKLLAMAFPVELYSLTPGFTNPKNALGVTETMSFGDSVHASPDLNGDGVGDMVAGAPNYFTAGLPSSISRGAAVVFSGATGARIGLLTGPSHDLLGDAVLGGLQDLDGDGFAEFLVGGSLGDNPSTDVGTLRCYRLFPVVPGTYCTAKTNSLGCLPAIGSSGSPSKGSAAPFDVTCANLVNKKSGVLIYSHKPGAAAFQGGFLCIKTPLKRVGAQSSGGSATGSDCTGTFSFDFRNQIQSGVDPTLVIGSEVFCQYWSRDPQAPSGTSLSNALRFLINP
jgi:hypothetical protein